MNKFRRIILVGVPGVLVGTLGVQVVHKSWFPVYNEHFAMQCNFVRELFSQTCIICLPLYQDHNVINFAEQSLH